jgi:lactoylglutathione lyase
MAFSEVHHVALTVSDLDQSLAFYTELLGFRKTLDMKLAGPSFERLFRLEHGATARAVILQQGKSRVGEIELIEFAGPGLKKPSGPKRPGDPGMLMLSFEVKQESLQQVAERLKARDVPFFCDPVELDLPGYGPIKALMVEDPDGALVELVELPARV